MYTCGLSRSKGNFVVLSWVLPLLSAMLVVGCPSRAGRESPPTDLGLGPPFRPLGQAPVVQKGTLRQGLFKVIQ
ncbi:hypothetical protein J1605_021549 [Eschrichtius robustus]|uniref:Uncharacterized protein n=1 Tax=Eschrichtius robustus TaxID=9764 RepID=A0AB34HAL7_ESCRO|nr:hypothetical protein J1605_021549 [Eschrichtius robustus]